MHCLHPFQVFNRDTKCYVCKNKYVGRELTEDGFQQTLRHFLHNGRRFRTDIVEQIICKLTDLRKVVASLDSFRLGAVRALAVGSATVPDTAACLIFRYLPCLCFPEALFRR